MNYTQMNASATTERHGLPGPRPAEELRAPTPMVSDLVAAAYRQERFNGGGQLTLGRTGAKPDDVLFW